MFYVSEVPTHIDQKDVIKKGNNKQQRNKNKEISYTEVKASNKEKIKEINFIMSISSDPFSFLFPDTL